MATDSLKPLADALHSTSIHLLRGVRRVDQAAGLSPARLSALSVIVFAGPITVGRLAAAEQVKSPTMSGIVNGLAEEGLVERRATGSDKRAVEVVVTPKGRQLFDAARSRRVDAVADVIKSLPAAELDVLEEAVAILNRALAGPSA